jgi:hypothetical protein
MTMYVGEPIGTARSVSVLGVEFAITIGRTPRIGRIPIAPSGCCPILNDQRGQVRRLFVIRINQNELVAGILAYLRANVEGHITVSNT